MIGMVTRLRAFMAIHMAVPTTRRLGLAIPQGSGVQLAVGAILSLMASLGA